MQPVERPLSNGGKVGVALFASLALGMAVWGLFTKHELTIGSVRVVRELFPLVIFAALGGVLFSVLLGLGSERCRFCKRPLVVQRRRFPTADLVSLSEALERERPDAVPDLAPPAAEGECLVLLVATCPEPCMKAGTVELVEEYDGGGGVVVEKRFLAGPTVRAFHAVVLRAPQL